MAIIIGKFYKIVINIPSSYGDKILTYRCKVLELKDGFISFKDINFNIYNYNINHIVSYDEIQEFEVNK